MLINKKMSLKEIIEKYPETLVVFENAGFKGLDRAEILKKVENISLEQAMSLKKEDVNIFLERLNEVLIPRTSSDTKANIIGLLPCPVRIPLLEGFEKFLNTNKDISINYDLKAASAGLDWIKDMVADSNDVDDLADLFMSAGFDLFFDKNLMGKFKAQGIFKDLTGLKKYNEDFENDAISLRDPHGDYSMIAVVPAIFVVNKKLLKGRAIPKSWSDILEPDFANSVALPIADFDMFTSILIHIYKKFSMEGVRNLGRNLLSNLHPAEMIESSEPAISIMPYFFSKMIGANGDKIVVWPEDGAIISPIFMLTKATKGKELDKVIKFMSGEKVGSIIANQGLFPVVNPNVKNPTSGKKFMWVGWDFIYNNDIGQLITECRAEFKKGVEDNASN